MFDKICSLIKSKMDIDNDFQSLKSKKVEEICQLFVAYVQSDSRGVFIRFNSELIVDNSG